MYGSSSGAMATPVMLASERILPMVRLYTPKASVDKIAYVLYSRLL